MGVTSESFGVEELQTYPHTRLNANVAEIKDLLR